MSDIQYEVEGNNHEQISVSFEDYSVIQDLSQNHLTSQKLLHYIRKSEYIDESKL